MKMWMIAVFLLVASTGIAQAEDFSTAMAKTISEIPEGADVASMGNANTSLPSDYSTRNPGAVDASDVVERNKVGVAASYGNISFQQGPSVNLYYVSGAVRLPRGTFQLTYANGGSSTGTIDELGSTLKFNSFPSVDMQYGLKLGENILLKNDEFFAGAGYSYSESKLTGKQIVPTSATTLIFNITSKSTSYTLETGMLYRIARKINFGAMWLHSWDRSKDSVEDFAQITKSQTDQLRLGISAKITPLTLVSADWHHLYLPQGRSDDQLFVGIEQYLIKDCLAIYGGWANGGSTTGLGIYLPHGGINVGYMHNPMHATKEFLGKAQVLMATAYLTF